MKFLSIIFVLLLSFSIFGQKADDVLATAANGKKFTAENLDAEVRDAFLNFPERIAKARTALLNQQIADVLLETEAAQQKTTIDKLYEANVKGKIAEPTDAQIKAVFEANRESVGNKTLAEVSPEIIAFLRREPEQKAYENYVLELRTKYKVAFGKDVNALDLQPFERLATVGTKQITAADFDAKNKVRLSDLEGNIYDAVRENLENAVASDLLITEAAEINVAPSDIIAREITNNLKEFSAEEREKFTNALNQRLFKKYNAKFLLKAPAPFVQKISLDDDPSRGNKNAPVTVVMFSDFQCSACSAAHPILEKVLAEYKDKIHFVVRDFPLMKIHENAFNAALAADAANAQGKFFEYTDVLYNNQDKLDIKSLKKYAADLGLNQKQFDLDLTSEKYADEIRKDMADGAKYGISGTPTIYVNGVKVRRLTASGFRNAIEKALGK